MGRNPNQFNPEENVDKTRGPFLYNASPKEKERFRLFTQPRPNYSGRVVVEVEGKEYDAAGVHKHWKQGDLSVGELREDAPGMPKGTLLCSVTEQRVDQKPNTTSFILKPDGDMTAILSTPQFRPSQDVLQMEYASFLGQAEHIAHPFKDAIHHIPEQIGKLLLHR